MPTHTTKGRPVSRTERALTEEQAREIIESTDHCVLATCDAAGVSYAVPVTPVLVGSVIYFHATARPDSRRRDNLLAHPDVSLCFIGKANTLPDLYAVDYASAIVQGRASRVTDSDVKMAAMKLFLKRHAPGNDPAADDAYLQGAWDKFEVWRVDIESMTAKARCAAHWQKGVSLGRVDR